MKEPSSSTVPGAPDGAHGPDALRHARILPMSGVPPVPEDIPSHADHPSPAHMVREALRAGQTEMAADLLLEHIWELFFDDPRSVGALLAELPRQAVAARPGLVMLSNFIAPLPLLPSRGFTSRLRTDLPLRLDGLTDEERDWYFMARVVMHRMRSEFAEAHDIAARLRPRLRRPLPGRRRPTLQMLAGWMVQIGATELLAGDLDRALADFEEAATLPMFEGGETFRHDALVRSAMIHAIEGRLQLADSVLTAAREVPVRRNAYAERVNARRTLVEALVAVERMDAAAPDLLVASDEWFGDELWPVRLLARVRWELANANPAAALERVDSALRARPAPPGSLAYRLTTALRAEAMTMLGIAGPDPAPDDATCPWIALARAKQLLPEPARALRAARRLAASPNAGPTVRVEALLLATWAHERINGEIDQTHLRSAVALMRQEELWRPLALVPARIVAAAGVELPAVVSVATDRAVAARLTPREHDVLHRLAEPLSLQQIALDLHVSLNTVKSQVRSVYRRLGANSRAEAVAIATMHGLLDDTPDRASAPTPGR